MAGLIGGVQALLLTTCTGAGLCFVAFVTAASIGHFWEQIAEAFTRVMEGIDELL